MKESKDEDWGLARRVLHMCAPVFLIYYLVPDDSWIGIPKSIALLVILLIVFLGDFLRVLFDIGFFGIRPYERIRISAHAWASLGFVLAFLLFNPVLVVPVVLGMAWIDPLCGFLRRKKFGYPLIPLNAYAIIMFLSLFVLSDFAIPKIIVLALVGSMVAIAAEYPNLKLLDDDFTMVLLPLLALALIDFVM